MKLATKIQVCLVCKEAIINISPALDEAIKPEKIILVVSPQMHQYADNLTQVLKKDAQIEVSKWEIENAWDIEHIRTRLMELLETLDNDVSLNATGGTKPMSMAAFEVFRAYEKAIFFVRAKTDQLIWLYPNNRPLHELANKAQLHHFLNAYGAEVEGRGNNSVLPAWKALTDLLIQRIDRYAKPIRTLNYFAHQAENNLISPSMANEQRKYAGFNDLLDLFEQAGLFKLVSNRMQFSDESARFFCNGGWLEQHVYATIMALKKKQLTQIQDLSQSLEVLKRSPKGKAIKNELDIAFLADNFLHIIECKTKRFKYKESNKGGGTETLYKLDTLQDLYGGLNAKSMLISYLPLSEYDRRRAADLNIHLCEGNQIQNLKSVITEWVEL